MKRVCIVAILALGMLSERQVSHCDMSCMLPLCKQARVHDDVILIVEGGGTSSCALEKSHGGLM